MSCTVLGGRGGGIPPRYSTICELTKPSATPGLIMALATKPANNQGDFASQRALLEDGIRTALRLQAWLRDNQALLNQWHSAVDAALAGASRAS